MTSPTTTNTTGTCTLLLFGPAQTYCDNTESLSLSAPSTLDELFEEVERRFSGFGEKILRGSQVVVNLEYVEWEWRGSGKGHGEGDVRVKVGDEVGVVPPVSAG